METIWKLNKDGKAEKNVDDTADDTWRRHMSVANYVERQLAETSLRGPFPSK